MAKFRDLTGEKFNYLTVIEKHVCMQKRDIRRGKYKCICICGNITYHTPQRLISGRSISCGCTRKNRKIDDRIMAIAKRVFATYKNNATNRGKDFKLKFEDWYYLITLPCFYCGAIGSNKAKDLGGGGKIISDFVLEYNGIDRVDNFVGYEYGNVVTCCRWCNSFKSDRTQDDFFNHVKILVENLNNKGLINMKKV
jgi:hypothetical protein